MAVNNAIVITREYCLQNESYRNVYSCDTSAYFLAFAIMRQKLYLSKNPNQIPRCPWADDCRCLCRILLRHVFPAAKDVWAGIPWPKNFQIPFMVSVLVNFMSFAFCITIACLILTTTAQMLRGSNQQRIALFLTLHLYDVFEFFHVPALQSQRMSLISNLPSTSNILLGIVGIFRIVYQHRAARVGRDLINFVRCVEILRICNT